jgi:hypothetical protein
MTAPRRVDPEWLDVLPATDPRALRSRRDLKLVNAWMLQAGIMARSLRNQFVDQPPRTIIDLGAGDGTFMLSVARRLAPRWTNIAVTLLDRQDIVSEATLAAFRGLQWKPETIAMDAIDFLERSTDACAVTANLFLHHFERDQLQHLLAGIARIARAFIACEPRRAPLPLLASKMLWALGCNDVSRHDAAVSVRAGFAGRELTGRWPDSAGWDLYENSAWLFTHLFVARRKAVPQ